MSAPRRGSTTLEFTEEADGFQEFEVLPSRNRRYPNLPSKGLANKVPEFRHEESYDEEEDDDLTLSMTEC